MALRMSEGIAADIKTYLSNNIAATLTALDTEYGDDITLDAPTFYLAAQAAESLEGKASFIILVDGPRMPEWTPTWQQGLYELVVGVVVFDQETEALVKRLKRYLRAIWELLMVSNSDSGIPFLVGVGDFDPEIRHEEVFTVGSSAFVTDGLVRIPVTYEETL